MDITDYNNHFGYSCLADAISHFNDKEIDDSHNTLAHVLASYGTADELALFYKNLAINILNKLYNSKTDIVDNLTEETLLSKDIVFIRGGHYQELTLTHPITLYPFNNEKVIIDKVNIKSDYIHFYGISYPLNTDNNYHVYNHSLNEQYYAHNGLLLKSIGDYSQKLNSEKLSPLFCAIKHYNFPSFKYLLDKGFADPNMMGINDFTPLHYICSLNDEDNNINSPIQIKDLMLKYLLNKGAKVSQSVGANGLHPIHVAAMANNLSLVRILLDYGASLLEKTFDNNTVLHWACMKGSSSLIAYCLSQSIFESFLNNKGQTALHLAIKEQPISIIKTLVTEGYDINQMDAFGNTPFHYALIYKRFDLIDYFLPLSIPNILNKKHESVMLLAAKNCEVGSISNFFSIMTRFAKYRFSPNIKDENNHDSLYYMKTRTNEMAVKTMYSRETLNYVAPSLIEEYSDIVNDIINFINKENMSIFKLPHCIFLGDKELEIYLNAHKDDKYLKEIAGNLSLTQFNQLVDEMINASHQPENNVNNSITNSNWKYYYVFLPFINEADDEKNAKRINDDNIYWFDDKGKSLLYYAIIKQQESCVHKIINLYIRNRTPHYYIDNLGVSSLYCAISAINYNEQGLVDEASLSIVKACLNRDLNNMAVGYSSSMKMALRLNNVDLVKLLIDDGFDLNHKDRKDRTVYDYALIFNELNPNIIKLLKEHKGR